MVEAAEVPKARAEVTAAGEEAREVSALWLHHTGGARKRGPDAQPESQRGAGGGADQVLRLPSSRRT